MLAKQLRFAVLLGSTLAVAPLWRLPEASAQGAAGEQAVLPQNAAPARKPGERKKRGKREAPIRWGAGEVVAGSAAEPRPRGKVAATFPGFRVEPDGRSYVFVDLSANAPVRQLRGSAGELRYALLGAQVPLRNNKNPLITAHFHSPVSRARLVSSQGGVELVIALRSAAPATSHVLRGPSGGVRLEIEFPAGDYPLEEVRTPSPSSGDDSVDEP